MKIQVFFFIQIIKINKNFFNIYFFIDSITAVKILEKVKNKEILETEK